MATSSLDITFETAFALLNITWLVMLLIVFLFYVFFPIKD